MNPQSRVSTFVNHFHDMKYHSYLACGLCEYTTLGIPAYTASRLHIPQASSARPSNRCRLRAIEFRSLRGSKVFYLEVKAEAAADRADFGDERWGTLGLSDPERGGWKVYVLS